MPYPQPDYPTAWTYWPARRVWLCRYGGSLIGTLAIAVIFGGLTGSPGATALAGRIRARGDFLRAFAAVREGGGQE